MSRGNGHGRRSREYDPDNIGEPPPIPENAPNLRVALIAANRLDGVVDGILEYAHELRLARERIDPIGMADRVRPGISALQDLVDAYDPPPAAKGNGK